MRFILFLILLKAVTPCLSQSIEIKHTNAAVNEDLKYLKMESDTTDQYDNVINSSEKETTPKTFKKDDSRQKSNLAYDKDMLELNAFIQSSSKAFYTLKQEVSTQRTQRTPDDYRQLQMEQLVTLFSQKAPNSFEYFLFKYMSGNYNLALIDYLYNAERINPDNQEVQKQLTACAIILNEKQKALNYLDKLIRSGMIRNNLLVYASDLLLSIPTNGTLITHGIEDTYAVIYLQWKQQLRPDIQLISLELLQSDVYRSTVKNWGYILPKSQLINVSYLYSFCVLNTSKVISISMTLPKEYMTPIYQKCTVSGLTLEYSANSVKEIERRNADLWFNKLNKQLAFEQTESPDEKLASNYLPMLIQLYTYYTENKDADKQLIIENVLRELAVRTNTFPQIHKLTGIN